MSENIHRLLIPRRCNEAIDSPLDAQDELRMITAVAKKIEEVFDLLRIDHRNDHNMRDRPMRVARMYVQERLRGRFSPPPSVTQFENIENYDQLIISGPIELRSICAHHLMPIYGHAVIGIVPAPKGKIIGLSKYDRIVDHFAARFQIQEELVKQIANLLVGTTRPRGLAVRINAVHLCKTHRGVRASHRSRMINTAYCGVMEHDAALKQEFLQECLALKCAD